MRSKDPSDPPTPDKDINQDSVKGTLKVLDISKEHSSDEKEDQRYNTQVKLKKNKVQPIPSSEDLIIEELGRKDLKKLQQRPLIQDTDTKTQGNLLMMNDPADFKDGPETS